MTFKCVDHDSGEKVSIPPGSPRDFTDHVVILGASSTAFTTNKREIPELGVLWSHASVQLD